jgi:periplasmic copper chaperone A
MSIRPLSSLILASALFGALPAMAQHAPPEEQREPLACDCPPGVELTTAPWVRLVPPGVPNTAAYLGLRNNGDEDFSIVDGASPVSEVTELHDHAMDAAGVMRMRKVSGIPVPAGGAVELQPGGLHVMLIGLHAPLGENERVPITLVTDTGQTLRFDARVRRGTLPAHGTGHHTHHQHPAR